MAEGHAVGQRQVGEEHQEGDADRHNDQGGPDQDPGPPNAGVSERVEPQEVRPEGRQGRSGQVQAEQDTHHEEHSPAAVDGHSRGGSHEHELTIVRSQAR